MIAGAGCNLVFSLRKRESVCVPVKFESPTAVNNTDAPVATVHGEESQSSEVQSSDEEDEVKRK